MCNCPYPAYCQCYEVKEMSQEPEDFLKYVTVAHLKFEIQKVHDLITTLERMVDVPKIKEVLFNGAETHASILRCEAQYKELHKYISDCDSMRFEADQRLESMIKEMCKNHNNESHGIYRKCNRCENTTFQIRGNIQGDDLVFVCNACRYVD